MLVKGAIPSKEPIVKIGLVLPDDQKKSIEVVDLNTNDQYTIDISFDGKRLSDSEYQLSSIRAGRGFHWEKEIRITIEGELDIKVINGYLFVTNYIPLEKYLVCVATSEMSGDCPSALLIAQTIAARSWLLAAAEQKHANIGLDACNDDCCQRYQGKENITDEALRAAKNSRGKVVLFDDEICDTRYSKSCGGMSEHNENVWQGNPKPYLRGVFDSPESLNPDLSSEMGLSNWIHKPSRCFCDSHFVPIDQLKDYLGKVDELKNYFRWHITYSQNELAQLISKKTGQSFDSITALQPINRGISGRITNLRIKGEKKDNPVSIQLNSEYEIRRVLHPEFLYSSAFIIEINSTLNTHLAQLTLHGAGWGHGVGLCQIGALGMSLNGKSTQEILSHYFKSTELRKIYD